MPISLNSRTDLEATKGLAQAIRALTSDPEVPPGTQGYNRYTTQRAHWLGWLGVTPNAGSYERKTPAGQGAKYVYNHIVEPKMLLWLIEASRVRPLLVTQAMSGASAVQTLAGKSKAIRRVVPYSVVADALWESRAGLRTLFEPGSQANWEALVGLGAVLEYLGFWVVKKAESEDTLRAYPNRLHRYPLLNPRFVRQLRSGELEVHVWSDGGDARLDLALQKYAKSAGCRFVGSGKRVRKHFLHGRLFLPVELRGRASTMPDFAALGRRLKSLRDHLNAVA